MPKPQFPFHVKVNRCRIAYRCYQIYEKPREELEVLLGLDPPTVPEVSLAGITSDSVLLYQNHPDNQPSSLHLAIRVNGIKGCNCSMALRVNNANVSNRSGRIW